MRPELGRARAVARTNEGLNLKYVALGVVASFALAFILSGVTGVAMYEGWVSEAYSPLVMNIVSFFCLFVGSLYAGRRAGTAGWAHGSLTGILYLVMVSVIGLLAFDQLAPALVLVERGALGVLLGAVGGTVGINLGRS